MEFNALALLMEYVDGKWFSKECMLCSRDDIWAQFEGLSVDEVRLGNFRVYCSPLLHPELGIVAHLRDEGGDMHYLCSPILILDTDGEKPVDLVPDRAKTIKGTIDFF